MALMAGALGVLAALVSSAATTSPVPVAYLQQRAVVADTDSVAVRLDSLRADSLHADSLRADPLQASDSLAMPDTGLAARYLPQFRRDAYTATLSRRARPLAAPLGSYWRQETELDSTRDVFIVREQVGGRDVRYPVEIDYETYQQERRRSVLRQNFRDLSDQRIQQRARQSRGGLGVNIAIPGGRNSAFTTIFGAPEVDLRVTGQADISAGFNYRKSDQNVSITGKTSQIDPDFKQDLRLGIQGTIGDKLQVGVNWDTQSQFDFQNELKLQYTGYEDEIIQSIEAGNVFLNTPSTLIRGGQSLFGIKSEFQIGGLRLVTVASQQEGQSNSLSLSGGSETTAFDLSPTDYDDNTHFFLGYYFRNVWDEALANPPNITVLNGFERIVDVEVWKKRVGSPSPGEENVVPALALVDLGEPAELVPQADQYARQDVGALPDNTHDQYDPSLEDQLRENAEGTSTPTLLETGIEQPLSSQDYERGEFKLLEEGRDYKLDDLLGYISLNSRLQDGEALAVAFRYRANGQTYQVGDFLAQTGGSRGGATADPILLKLLRPANLKQPSADINPPAWYLQLRNIYRFPGSGLEASDFTLDIFYEPPGKTASERLPGVSGSQTLLQILGLDRLNEQNAPSPDNAFDFVPGITIRPGDGYLIFPTLEPFGRNLTQTIIGDDGNVSPGEQELIDEYAFEELYTVKKETARRDSRDNLYSVRGEYSGAIPSFYDLRSFSGVLEGSVRVTSGGTPLQEGVDYTVDYAAGTVTITNQAYRTGGRDIEIEYEQNSFLNLQKKTLLGVRADYDVNSRLVLGGTLMRLSQKSPIDKFRIGEEPISNTIWGLDGKLDLEPRWLTRAIDAMPLIQTRAPSAISISGEFAQLRPGHTQTTAFKRTRRNLQDINDDFSNDELRGISYIDDFEGFENTFSLRQPGAWQLSAPPDSIGLYPCLTGQVCSADDSLRTTQRAALAWYQLNTNLLEELRGKVPEIGPDVRPVLIKEVFPNKDVPSGGDPTQPTLDVYFDPQERGPYNYTTDLQGFLDNPHETWGGMTQRIPQGYTDFAERNIEFVEFIIRPFSQAGGGDAGSSAKLYVDLGAVSEDVIPNGRLNEEDGLSTEPSSSPPLDRWSRRPTGQQNNAINVNEATRRTEDLGLDGLVSYDPDAYEPELTEAHHFRDFLDAMSPGAGDERYRAEVAKALRDPSGDDYYYFNDDSYFGNPELFPGGATIQQRFSRYAAATELNAYEAQNQLGRGDVKRGNARYPDTEDLNLNSSIDTDNSYFQYEIPLSTAVLDSMAHPERVDDYVVGEITDDNGNGTGWYQVRIPVNNYTRRVGSIRDFTLIESIRMWTTGHVAPITLRFAEIELVGSQWRKEDRVAMERETILDTTETRLSIASINNEENLDTYKTPLGTVISQIRETTGTPRDAREQAMVLRVEDLMPGKQRAISKTYQGHDLLKYENLRMFVHMHGTLGDGTDLVDLEGLTGEDPRSKVRLFVRLGANESGDYYEYEQPLSPSRVGSNVNDLWQTNQEYNGRIVDLNSMNIRLSALNQLKVARDERSAPTDSVFWSDVNSVPLNPAIEEFAPPGTRIGIKGSPNLGQVNTIIIGIRNPADSTSLDLEDVLDDVTIWVNELRVAGYDEGNGWAAVANADFQLADFGRVRANFQTQTDGFGSLSSSLGERDQRDIINWGVNTDVNLDKFIPERYGWDLPVSLQVQSNTSTPRFSPNQGDIRLDEIVDQIESDTSRAPAERDRARREAIESAQTFSLNRSVTASVRKSNSRSPVLRYTLDGLSANFAHSTREGRTPSQRMNDQWQWSSNVSYRLSIRQPRTFRPFGWLGSVPVLGWLGGLDFNYLPNSFSVSATAARNFSQSRDRNTALRSEQDATRLPEEIEFPFREQHSFSHRRNMALQYNPFGFLNLSFDTNTNQSLSALGADTTFSVFMRDPNDSTRFNVLPGSFAQNGIPDSLQGVDAFQQERLNVRSFGEVVDDVLKGADQLRTEDHGQRFSGTFRPQLGQITALNWINVQDVVYDVQFGWRNGPVGRNTGATVSNTASIRGGISLRPQEFWQKFDFYQTLEEKQREAEQEARARRQEREQARVQRREERRRQREEEERRRAAGEEAPDEEAPDAEAPDEEAPDEAVVDSLAVDGEVAPPDSVQVEEEGAGFRLPLPDPGSLARRFVLAITGMRDFTVTYTGSRSSNLTNVGEPVRNQGRLRDVETHYSLLDAIRGNGPPLGYRFGFDRTIDPNSGYRIVDSTLQVTDALQNSNRVTGRTSINPSQNLQISLNWNVDWSTGENITYRPAGLDSVLASTTSNGSNRASIWAFGASPRALYEKQLDRYEDDVRNLPPGQSIRDRNGDGVVLTNQSVSADFRSTFVSSLGVLDGRGLLPFPMPGWTISYSGIGNWPLLRRLAQTVTLRNTYSADYSTDYRTNALAASQDSASFDLQGRQVLYELADDEVGSMRVNERFSPLIGMDINWRGQVQTNLAWNKSNTYSLTSALEVSETKTNELTFTANYSRQGMRLPFLRNRINNRITFSLTMSRSRTDDHRFSLRRALESTISDPETFDLDRLIQEGMITAFTRTSVAPQVSYQFSDTVSASFNLRYERFDSKDGIQPSYTSLNGGFNIRVSIAN